MDEVISIRSTVRKLTKLDEGDASLGVWSNPIGFRSDHVTPWH